MFFRLSVKKTKKNEIFFQKNIVNIYVVQY